MQSRRAFFDASPISYATIDKRERTSTRFLARHQRRHRRSGDAGRGLPHRAQAGGFFARRIVIQGSGHFWASDPPDEPGGYGAQAAPHILRFLQSQL